MSTWPTPSAPKQDLTHVPNDRLGLGWKSDINDVRCILQVSKWGNSLAIRLPQAVVEALDLKEGDQVEVTVAGKRDLRVDRDRRREKALETIRRLARPFPPGWKFDREELYERSGPQKK